MIDTIEVAAVVLAAGRSRRMAPVNKLLADMGGRAVVAHVAASAVASRASSVTVVLGHEAERVRDALSGLPVTFAENVEYDSGLSASVRAGIAAVADTADGAVILLGDMPAVRAAHIDRLIAAFDRAGRQDICIPVCGNRRGNPVLWPCGLFPEMMELSGDAGARVLLAEHAGRIREVKVDDDAVLMDVDTAEDLHAVADRAEKERA